MKEFYTIKLHCANCGQNFVEEVAVGVLAVEFMGSVSVNNTPIKCPNCETCKVTKVL